MGAKASQAANVPGELAKGFHETFGHDLRRRACMFYQHCPLGFNPMA
jgi:hypothetical protein